MVLAKKNQGRSTSRSASGFLDQKQFENLKTELTEVGVLHFKVVSGSMEPLIMTGEPITVGPLNERDWKKFRIVVFWDGSRLICHYIWHVNFLRSAEGFNSCVTKGLYGGEDLPVTADRILGAVVSHSIGPSLRHKLILRSLFMPLVWRWKKFIN